MKNEILGILLCAAILLSLSGCAQSAPGAAALMAAGTPTSGSAAQPGIQGVPTKSSGKLSSRLQMLADSPTLQSASLAEQARALSLPAKGPGSLMRDAQGRLSVDIHMTDVSETQQQALQKAGAVIIHVSPNYQVVTAAIPVTDLAGVANLPAVQNIQEILAPVTGGGAGGGGAVIPKQP